MTVTPQGAQDPAYRPTPLFCVFVLASLLAVSLRGSAVCRSASHQLYLGHPWPDFPQQLPWTGARAGDGAAILLRHATPPRHPWPDLHERRRHPWSLFRCGAARHVGSAAINPVAAISFGRAGDNPPSGIVRRGALRCYRPTHRFGAMRAPANTATPSRLDWPMAELGSASRPL